jgi:hypothetical protein
MGISRLLLLAISLACGLVLAVVLVAPSVFHRQQDVAALQRMNAAARLLAAAEQAEHLERAMIATKHAGSPVLAASIADPLGDRAQAFREVLRIQSSERRVADAVGFFAVDASELAFSSSASTLTSSDFVGPASLTEALSQGHTVGRVAAVQGRLFGMAVVPVRDAYTQIVGAVLVANEYDNSEVAARRASIDLPLAYFYRHDMLANDISDPELRTMVQSEILRATPASLPDASRATPARRQAPGRELFTLTASMVPGDGTELRSDAGFALVLDAPPVPENLLEILVAARAFDTFRPDAAAAVLSLLLAFVVAMFLLDIESRRPVARLTKAIESAVTENTPAPLRVEAYPPMLRPVVSAFNVFMEQHTVHRTGSSTAAKRAVTEASEPAMQLERVAQADRAPQIERAPQVEKPTNPTPSLLVPKVVRDSGEATAVTATSISVARASRAESAKVTPTGGIVQPPSAGAVPAPAASDRPGVLPVPPVLPPVRPLVPAATDVSAVRVEPEAPQILDLVLETDPVAPLAQPPVPAAPTVQPPAAEPATVTPTAQPSAPDEAEDVMDAEVREVLVAAIHAAFTGPHPVVGGADSLTTETAATSPPDAGPVTPRTAASLLREEGELSDAGPSERADEQSTTVPRVSLEELARRAQRAGSKVSRSSDSGGGSGESAPGPGHAEDQLLAAAEERLRRLRPPTPVASLRTVESGSNPAVSGSTPMLVSPRGSASGSNVAGTDDYRPLFEAFRDAKARCGESIDRLTYEKFYEKVMKNRQQILGQFGCRDVHFDVVVKEGKATLKATPVP